MGSIRGPFVPAGHWIVDMGFNPCIRFRPDGLYRSRRRQSLEAAQQPIGRICRRGFIPRMAVPLLNTNKQPGGEKWKRQKQPIGAKTCSDLGARQLSEDVLNIFSKFLSAMGLFDTVHFPEPLEVPGCDELVTEVQTKQFGNLMQNYRVGSFLQESPVLIGVVEDSIWCKPKVEGEKGTTHPVYFAIWHRILAGVYLDSSRAEDRVRTVDRLDLITWLDEAQRKTLSWQRRYHGLFRDVAEWQERQHESQEEGNEKDSLRRIWRRLPDEVLQSSDPLAAILALHREKEKEPDDKIGLFW